MFAGSFAALIPATLVRLDMTIVLILAISVTAAFAEALFAPLASAAAAQATPKHAQGRASALFQMSWAVSTIGAPALLTTLLSLGNPVLWATLALTSAAAVPAVFALRQASPLACCADPTTPDQPTLLLPCLRV